MVSKVTPTTSLPQVFANVTPLSKAKIVTLMALTVFAMGLLAVVIKRSLSGRAASGAPPIVPGTLPVICKYHPNLIDVLGGQEAFDRIPFLILHETNLDSFNPGLKPGLKIRPDQMLRDIMQGKDSLGRPFLAIKYSDRKTLEKSVDVWFCRDPELNRWYFNDERSPEEWSIDSGQPLSFLQELLMGNHRNYALGSSLKAIVISDFPKPLTSEEDIPLNQYPEQLVLFMGGAQTFNQFPVAYWADSRREDQVNSSVKLAEILNMRGRVETNSPINKGMDAWGCPFVKVDYVSKDNSEPGSLVIYCNIKDKNQIWYIQEKAYATAPNEMLLLRGLIRNTHPTYRLALSTNL